VALEAQVQNTYIAAHRSELDAQRASVNRLLDLARQELTGA